MRGSDTERDGIRVEALADADLVVKLCPLYYDLLSWGMFTSSVKGAVRAQ